MPSTRRNLREELNEADPEIERHILERRRILRQQGQSTMADQQNPPANPPAVEAPEEIKLRDRAIPNADDFRISIAHPTIAAQSFELKPGLISMIQQSQFTGSALENPATHLKQFLQLAGTIRINGISSDIIQLKLFPFSLRGKATEWLMSLEPESITS